MREEQPKNERLRLFGFRSIRSAILIPYLLLIGFTLAITFFFSIVFTNQEVLNNSIAYSKRLISQVSGNLDSYITYMDNISSMVSEGRDVRNYGKKGDSLEDQISMYYRIITTYRTVLNSRADIANIGVIFADGSCIINRGGDILNKNTDLENVDWITNVKNSSGSYLTTSHIQNVIAGSYQWVITLSRGIFDEETGEYLGVIFIDLNYEVIRKLCEENNLGTKGYLYILDSEGGLVYHPKQQLVYSGLRKEYTFEILEMESNEKIFQQNRERMLYTRVHSDTTGWTVVGVVDTNTLVQDKVVTQRLYSVLFLVLLLAALLIAVALSSALTKPIRRMSRAMHLVEQKQFDIARIPVEDQTEIGALANSFNLMTGRIDELMKENEWEQEQKRISDLKALQAQIHPHFLYNTLDSIIWMAEDGKNEEVILMTSALAKLLRQSINNEDRQVTIRQELEYTKNYLVIQKMRYQDRLEYEISPDPETVNCRMIRLVLQPLVENAIYHGIKYKDGIGKIVIRTAREGDDVVLTVCDNGVGMDAETMTHLFEERMEGGHRKGVGVSNVHRRLKMQYGEAYGLVYHSKIQEGTTVTVRIPYSTE